MKIKLVIFFTAFCIIVNQCITAQTSRSGPTFQTNCRDKNPGLAFLFSFLMPGGGQYYNGETVKGVTMTALSLGSIALILTDDGEVTGTYIGLAISMANSLWSMIDAPISANAINRANIQGLASIKIGNNKYLGLSPDIRLSSTPTLFGCSKIEPVVVMKLKLSL
jgi:hypothetical protein